MARKPIPVKIEAKDVAHESGVVVKVLTTTKGLLNSTTRSIEDSRLWHVVEPRGDDEIAVEWLNERKQDAQKILKAADLPTDHDSLWSFLSLHGKLEPCSREEIAADLVQNVNHVLANDGNLTALDALKFATALHEFIVDGGINEHVMADVEATENRLLGPQTKSNKSLRAREIVMGCARAYWKDHEQFKGNADHTARRIERAVNSKLAKEGLKELKDKTIAAHIRAAPE